MIKLTTRRAALTRIAIIGALLCESHEPGHSCPNGLGSPFLPIAVEAPCDQNNEQQHMITITIGSRVFKATLVPGPAADALRAILPLTVTMQELNGNEKFHQFDTGLPTSDHKPGTVQAGDLMLWSGNTLVLFYATFKTGYPYTRIGHIDDPEGLAEAVGKGKVLVRFEQF